MQPKQYPIDFHQLYRHWRQFVSQNVLDPQIDPLVAMSWRRCVPKNNPLTGSELPHLSEESLQSLRMKLFNLIAIARPFLEDIYQLVEGSGHVVVLLDGSGCVLEVLGDAAIVTQAENLGLAPGVYWDEGHAGTNAFGLALLERNSVQVVGAEHFFLQFHALTTTAAPIFNMEGHPIGILGLAGIVRESMVHTTAVVYSAARAIENQLQTDRLFMEVNAQRTQFAATLEAISDGLIVCDNAGLVTHMNARAGQILNLKFEAVVGRPFSEYVDLPDVVRQARRSNLSLSETEVIFQVKGLQIGCLMSLYPIRRANDGSIDGHIFILWPIEQIHRLVHRMVGARSNFTLGDYVGETNVINQVRRQSQMAARSQTPVLLTGESGTGKGVVARAIHNESARANGPFVSVNCRVLPRDLIVSEFLGYEVGVVRGNHQGQPSKFELAHGGTLHLEDVDTLPLEMQAALLRVIETGEVLRLGGRRVIPVDVRFIATSGIDLEQHVVNGDFRADLYYALSRISIRLPALRDRLSDLPLLASATLERLRRQGGRRLEISSEAMQVLRHYRWPGNVREMENVLERAAAVAEQGIIEVRHLPDAIRGRSGRGDHVEHVPALHEAEYEAIVRAGWACHGNLNKMAQVLGIGRTTLWRKMKATGIRLEDFRSLSTSNADSSQ
jgi:transcriptional regulator of acetoin/glycerol metabolism